MPTSEIKCTDCGGGSICQHQRQRSTCKDCGGGSICQHQRERSTCISCQLYDEYEDVGLEPLSALFKRCLSQVDKLYILRVIANKIAKSCTKKSSSAFLPYFFDNYNSLYMNDSIDQTFKGMITWLHDNENDDIADNTAFD